MKKSYFFEQQTHNFVFREILTKNDNVPKIYKELLETEEAPKTWKKFPEDSTLYSYLYNNATFIIGDKILFLTSLPFWDNEQIFKVLNYFFYMIAELGKKLENFDPTAYTYEYFVLCTDPNVELKRKIHVDDIIAENIDVSELTSRLNVTVLSHLKEEDRENSLINMYFRFTELEKRIWGEDNSGRDTAHKLVLSCIEDGIFKEYFESKTNYATIVFSEYYSTEEYYLGQTFDLEGMDSEEIVVRLKLHSDDEELMEKVRLSLSETDEEVDGTKVYELV